MKELHEMSQAVLEAELDYWVGYQPDPTAHQAKNCGYQDYATGYSHDAIDALVDEIESRKV